MHPGVIRNDEGMRREERAASMITERARQHVDVDSPQHGLLKIKTGVCQLVKHYLQQAMVMRAELCCGRQFS